MATETLSVESLDRQGAFVADKLTRRKIEWVQNGQDYDGYVYVRPMTYYTAVENIQAAAANGDTEAVAVRIASTICKKDGSPVFTVADILGTANKDRGPLDGNLVLALLGAIAGGGDDPKTPASRTTKSSGVKSSSRGSAAKQ